MIIITTRLFIIYSFNFYLSLLLLIPFHYHVAIALHFSEYNLYPEISYTQIHSFASPKFVVTFNYWYSYLGNFLNDLQEVNQTLRYVQEIL